MRALLQLVVLTSASSLCACALDVYDAEYQTHAEALASGAIAKGWIPDWLPPQATDIREVHNVDSNESALAFSLPIGYEWQPPKPCVPANGGQFSEPAFSRDWLPRDTRGFTYFSCPSGVAFGPASLIAAVAVQPGKGRVLHWRAFAR